MSKIYFTLTGTNHYFGKEFLKKGTKICLEKEPDNEYDKEAIKVTYAKKAGGSYVAYSGIVKKIDEYEHTIIMTDQTVIPIEQISDIKCEEW